MYLKVYYAPKSSGHEIATVDEVKKALPDDAHGLTVDNDLGYPSVNFPDGAVYADVQKVKEHLKKEGFETE